MAGIISYGAYVPLYRLDRREIAKAWGRYAIPGEKAVANFDEDSVTMAVAAAIDCLGHTDRQAVDALYFATTTAPYKEKGSSSIIASALDLRRDIRTGDFTDSLKAGTTAMASALDAIRGGSAKNVLTIASDYRIGAAQGDFEQLFGDGAAAILLGDSGIAVSIEGSYSLVNEFTDLWRSESDSFVRSWEERFSASQGYMSVLKEAVSGLMNKYHLTPKDFSKVVLYAPDARNHTAMAKSLGFDPKTQVQTPLFASIGHTGAALSLMMLVAALEEAKAGDRILLTNYGDGSDCFILRVTEEIENVKSMSRRGIKGYLEAKEMIPNYEKYVRYRDLIEIESARRPAIPTPSVPAMWRERKTNLSLYGHKCKACGNIEYPPQRVCVYCQSRDNFEDVRFSDKRGKVFTFTHDNLASGIDPPITFAVVDFEGGGRIVSEMTDRVPAKVKIDLPVEMTFRKLYKAGGIHNYYWKCRPMR